MAADGPRRRSLLRVAVLALPLGAAGCKAPAGLGTPPVPLPDVRVLQEAIGREKLMIARYRAVVAAVPGLAGRLGPLLAEHRAHLSRLRARLVPGAAPAGGTPPARTRPPNPPAATAAALGYLQAAEDTAAAALTRDLATVPPSLAQLFASIAASEATHAVSLAGPRSAG